MNFEKLPAIPLEEDNVDISPNGNLLRSQAEMLLNLSDLIDTLRTTDEPERTQYDFEFVPGVFMGAVELPRSITDYCGDDLQTIHLGVVKETGNFPTASLELAFADKTLFISRDFSNPDAEEPDAVWRHVDEGFPVPIDRIPRRDINALVLQLVSGRCIGQPDELERIDVFSPDSCNVLLDVLPDTAQSRLTSGKHTLGPTRSLTWVTESHGGTDQLQVCRFAYETATSGRSIVALIDMQEGLQVTFETQEYGEAIPYIADEGDMLRLQEIIEDLAGQYGDTQVEPQRAQDIEKNAFDLPPEVDI